MEMEIQTLKQAKRELEIHIEHLMNKIEEFEEKLKHARAAQSEEAKVG